MRSRKIGYWVTTALVCAMFAMSGVMSLMQVDAQEQVMLALGFPVYLLTLLGIAKILAVVALLMPARPLLKEWAYAGLVFDMIGAGYSHFMVGDPIGTTITPFVFLALTIASYILRPDSRRLG
jgi:uncharacterized membrane protein YphA (DoxX/SURF4 family)